MKKLVLALTAGMASLTAGCATTQRAAPVDVTRFHLNMPVQPGSFTVEPLRTNATISPEYQTYADAVSREMERLDFTPTRTTVTGDSQYVVSVSFVRATRGYVDKPAPFSVGLGAGGGSFGRRSGVGLGGGVTLPVGRGRQQAVIGSELSAQIRRRTDNTVVWEGRAVTESLEGKPGTQPITVADKLANALFRGFPGESGITTTVK
ncbi:DUF4136 domain-containing protein [Sphingomonas sp. PL-96]|uniref:DUF4136 domain-containing protein n=1 Tax=Sphingomonas sp. PL-96 TaxID=2887201 RepID=UPI001E33932C|nr:DUF4136 domain-containing protein [Sphingomonas sp. PL-96]MCC2978096.1 DUF4136 domain-containing protein [Sphingomonas sp. PL-96]